jgi:hypothetical protein
VLAPSLFNLFIDTIARQILRVVQSVGVKVLYKIDGQINISKFPDLQMILWLLMYADDITLICVSEADLRSALSSVYTTFQKWGMDVSVPKTKIMVVRKPLKGTVEEAKAKPNIVISLDGQSVETVDKFTCLGSVFTSDNSMDAEIAFRVSRAAAAFSELRAVLWSDRHISLDTKVKVFQSVVLSALLYGGETWAITLGQLNKLEVFQSNCLRVLCGVSRVEHISNKVLRDRCKLPEVAEQLRERRLSWLGHLGRMDDSRIPKCMLFGKAEGKRSRGGARATWAKLVLEDLSIRKIQKWYKQCQDRAEWYKLCKAVC